jgi:uncharacterized membrane protein YuzA (DUF378 family)
MHTRSLSRSTITDRRRLLTAIAVLLGIGEFGDSFFISFWEGAAVFCVLFFAAALWTRRGGIGGPILIGVLCAFEIQGFFQWARGGTADWISQIAFLVVSIAGVVVVVALLKNALDTRRANQHVARVRV